MQKSATDNKKLRGELKSIRDVLLEKYSKNPAETRLAIEIRRIDDQIAELTAHLVQQRKSDQQ
jgi:hypothetical protein